ncbi:hypothetical protein ENBRE01_1349 [Enteropsectra breve]|nr:hypothetical protein ENBRE01_1349 [Enteropsectra breve]
MMLGNEENTKKIFATREEISLFAYSYNLSSQRTGKVIQSNKYVYLMKCIDLECSFKFEVKRNKKHLYEVTAFDQHSCNTQRSCIKNKLVAMHIRKVENTVSNLSTKDCQQFLINNCGITTTFNKAYAGLRHLRQGRIQNEERSFSLIHPWLLEVCRVQNGTRIDYLNQENEDGTMSFKYCALIPSYAYNTFQNTLPIFTLDACHTKGKYKGIIMVATAITGHNKGIIIGYAIAPSENEEYWTKFLQLLNESLLLNNARNLVIISDREKGLENAIQAIVPSASHSFCLAHIERNIVSRYRRSCPKLWPAARVYSPCEFENYMTQIENDKGPAVAGYIRSIPRQNWASAFFPVPRFGHITSNVAEAINSSLASVRKMQPLDIMIGISRIINANILKNSISVETFRDGELDKTLAIQLEELLNKARFLSVAKIPNSDMFEVQKVEGCAQARIVNAENGECSCLYTREFGLPCIHACTIINVDNAVKDKFISEKRMVGALKQVYSGYITMIDTDNLVPISVASAYSHNRRGRPANRERIRAQAEIRMRRRKTYSKCAQPGHDKRKCPRNRNFINAENE